MRKSRTQFLLVTFFPPFFVLSSTVQRSSTSKRAYFSTRSEKQESRHPPPSLFFPPILATHSKHVSYKKESRRVRTSSRCLISSSLAVTAPCASSTTSKRPSSLLTFPISLAGTSPSVRLFTISCRRLGEPAKRSEMRGQAQHERSQCTYTSLTRRPDQAPLNHPTHSVRCFFPVWNGGCRLEEGTSSVYAVAFSASVFLVCLLDIVSPSCTYVVLFLC